MNPSEFNTRWKSGIQATLLREPKRNAIITAIMMFLAVILLLAGSISPWVAAILIFLNPILDLARAAINSYRVAKNPKSEQSYQDWLAYRAKHDQERKSPSDVPLNWYGWYRQTWPESRLRSN